MGEARGHTVEWPGLSDYPEAGHPARAAGGWEACWAEPAEDCGGGKGHGTDHQQDGPPARLSHGFTACSRIWWVTHSAP